MTYTSLAPRRYVGRFPGATPPTYSVTPVEEVAPELDRKYVLIVDDDPYFRSLLTVMLKQTGLNVADIWEAEDSQRAFGICRTKPVDLVFCDLNLPIFQSKNGLEIIREMRLTLPDLPIYMVTAENSEALIERVRASGATGHILKPINLRVLKRALLSAWSKKPEAARPSRNPGE